MRVERQGRKIQVVLKEGNQERWFNIEEHEAQELALRLGEVLSEPKKPKFVVGDRVRVTKPDESWYGRVFNVTEVQSSTDNIKTRVGWFGGDWVEKVEPNKLKFNVGDRVRVTRESIVSEKPADRELTVKDFFSEDAIRVEENDWAWPVDWLEKVGEEN